MRIILLLEIVCTPINTILALWHCRSIAPQNEGKVRGTPQSGGSILQRSMLECSVWGFFPKEVSVSWLRDGVEVTTDVASTDVMANGDWSYQLHSYLEFTPRKWERVTCRVDHRSLRAAFFSRDLLHDIIVSIATSNSSSLHHDVHFLNYGPI
uniref:Ig-like domain-containing protein n=1 Tax=Sparus aurata TaxID=8175 RepID=A0A671WFS0_SPAAU